VDDWGNYYVIVGSSGAALVGIQFVVITLVASREQRPTTRVIHAFATPTVVHLGAALTISAVMSAPWHSLIAISVALVVAGVAGTAYCAIMIRRMRHQTEYTPVWQDWLWYAAFPCASYAALAIGAALFRSTSDLPHFVIAAAALALLLIGIHNAWDTVIDIVASKKAR
jgi:hypothetical protein